MNITIQDLGLALKAIYKIYGDMRVKDYKDSILTLANGDKWLIGKWGKAKLITFEEK